MPLYTMKMHDQGKDVFSDLFSKIGPATYQHGYLTELIVVTQALCEPSFISKHI